MIICKYRLLKQVFKNQIPSFSILNARYPCVEMKESETAGNYLNLFTNLTQSKNVIFKYLMS